MRFFCRVTLGRTDVALFLPRAKEPAKLPVIWNQQDIRRLFDATPTLQTFGRDTKWLGGELGITMVLHTWNQVLEHHIHVHCVVTGGALSPEHDRWIATKRRDFLFPVKALSKVFRSKYLGALGRAYRLMVRMLV